MEGDERVVVLCVTECEKEVAESGADGGLTLHNEELSELLGEIVNIRGNDGTS